MQQMFVQIVTFKLKPDVSREMFIQHSGRMVAWLKSRKGFIAYELYEGIEFWSDRIVWHDKIDAEAGLKDFLSTDVARQIMSLVEDDYSSFMGNAVVAV
jgi:quinol monooxygenase YgiN